MKVYEVGGCVRDGIMGIEPKDIDYVVVGAIPDDMIAAGYKQVGSDFPVFLHPITGDECALARVERKTGVGYGGFDTDHSISVTLENDLIRRDLTMNAIAKDIETGELIDPYGGIADIDAGIIRHTSIAFAEDPVRVLRVARFKARYMFTIHPTTTDLMIDMHEQGELDHLTPERVWAETKKALMEPHAVEYFVTLDNIHAIDVLFPGFSPETWLFDTKNAELEARVALIGFTEETLTQLKAPSDCIKFIRHWDKVRNITLSMNEITPPSNVLRVFKQLDMFRNKKHIRWFKQVIDVLLINDIRDHINQMFEAASSVKFGDLPTDIRDNPDKSSISDEMNLLRLEKMSEVIE